MAWCYDCGNDWDNNKYAETNVCLKGHLLLCDSPCPEWDDVRCVEVVGHTGRCVGPNGPAWPNPRVAQPL